MSPMFNPGYPIFPIISFLGFFLCLLPLPWHLHSWNSGTCYYAIWASLASLNQFINSIIWAGDAINRAPVFCDISTRISLGTSVALPIASLCIQRRLYCIISSKAAVSTTDDRKQRVVIVDSLICVGFPMLFIALQYVVQGHRFDIFGGIGCRPFVYNTPVAFFVTYAPPLIIGIISATYCVLSLRDFSSRRAQIRKFLASNRSGLTHSNYIRFKVVVFAEIIFTIPLSIMIIIVNAFYTPIYPYISWSNVHTHFSRVRQVPDVVWRSDPLFHFSVELTRWLAPACALLFFAMFGLSEEARRNYRHAFDALLNHIGLNRKDTNLRRDALHPIQFHVSVQASSDLFSTCRDHDTSLQDDGDASESVLSRISTSLTPKCEKSLPDV